MPPAALRDARNSGDWRRSGVHVDQLGGVVLDVRGCVVRLAVGKSGVEFFYGDIGAGGLLC